MNKRFDVTILEIEPEGPKLRYRVRNCQLGELTISNCQFRSDANGYPDSNCLTGNVELMIDGLQASSHVFMGINPNHPNKGILYLDESQEKLLTTAK